LGVLKLRIITALVLVPVFVLSVLYLETIWFAALMGMVIALAAWEWAGIAGYKQALTRVGYTLLVILLLGTAFVLRLSSVPVWLIALALLWWLVALFLIMRYQLHETAGFGLPLPAAVIGLLVLVPPWLSLIVLHASEPDGVILVLFLLILIWSADIAAYFAGRRWGKKKLCSRVSPGKSWQGVYGALAASGLMGLAYATYKHMQGVDLLIFIVICLITVLASILGDLLESLMKRIANVKDSGSLLPGHGGVLDRIDSLTAALPVYIAALCLWGKIA
jgi:phosphatidate cytidylyltransferase